MNRQIELNELIYSLVNFKLGGIQKPEYVGQILRLPVIPELNTLITQHMAEINNLTYPRSTTVDIITLFADYQPQWDNRPSSILTWFVRGIE